MISETGATGVRAHLEFGWPAGKIVELGEEIGAGVIVMGSRGFGGVGGPCWEASRMRSSATPTAPSW